MSELWIMTARKVRKWGGRKADVEWTAAVLATYGTRCHLALPGCLGVATTGDHLIPRSQRPELEHDVSNGRPACLPCNRRRRDRPLSELRGYGVGTADVDNREWFESLSPRFAERARSFESRDDPARTPSLSPPRAQGKTTEHGCSVERQETS